MLQNTSRLLKKGTCHAERGEARLDGLFLVENKQKQILRCAQDDTGGGFFSSLLELSRLPCLLSTVYRLLP